MLKYVISAVNEEITVYFAGKHYATSGTFSSNIYHATQYTEGKEARDMAELLGLRFPSVQPFKVTPVRITIQELVQK